MSKHTAASRRLGTEQPDVEALASAARNGDQRAAERLVEAMYDPVYGWALVRTGDRMDAEDVCQDVMARLYDRLPSFDGRSKFTTWAFRMTANAVTDHYRRQRRHVTQRVELSAPEVSALGVEPTDAAALDRRRAAGLVRWFFELLPDTQRAVFHLVDLEGHQPKDVADMLAMNPNTVRANLLKARRTIRARMLERHAALIEDEYDDV